jgi:hypothetical protein
MSEIWWGKYQLEPSQELSWRIGPLRIWIFRGETEWRITHEIVGDSLDSDLEIATAPAVAPGPAASTVRFGFRETGSTIELRPVGADRPVIVKAEVPFFVPAEEAATVFVSTPIWVQILVARSADPLIEIPSHRLTDTWFGPSTLVGEPGYATRTGARLALERLPVRPHRATSVVRIRNRAESALEFARVRLPLPNMALYGSEDGWLWTEKLTLEREEEGEMARISLSRQAPREAAPARKVAGPRLEVEKGLLQRSFGGLFSLAGGSRHE